MSNFKLLILDANVVIYLHEISVWNAFISKCEVHLPMTVVQEAAFHDNEDEERHYIDLSGDIAGGKIATFEVEINKIKSFLDQFDPHYMDQLDPGELEALAYLCDSTERFQISSADGIVFRVLGRLNRSDQGISLEEILTKVGLQQSHLRHQFTQKFRESLTKAGQIDLVQGRGLK